jgi:hypothetical protein
MAKNYLFVIGFLCSTLLSIHAQVTGVYTDYQGYWHSNTTSINTNKPINSHNLIGFTLNGTVYSTGVNDNLLTSNSVTFVAENYRALPIATITNLGGYIGLGQLYDGIDNGVNNSNTQPFEAITNGTQAAYFLTDGIQGLDLGTGIANIPSGTITNFTLSSNGITQSKINDGIPDVLIATIATPSNNNNDILSFVDINGNIVGNQVVVSLNNSSNYPVVANWDADFYNFNSTQTNNSLVNTQRGIRFLAAELNDFGIDNSNYQQVVGLRYQSSGTTDPAFLAYNEQAIGVASQLVIDSQPTSSNCDGSLASSFQVRIADFNGATVQQAGYAIKASMYSGSGNLLGTLTQNTNASGIAIFNDLAFEVGGDHEIIFEYTSLDAAISATIEEATGCSDLTWTGAVNNNWENTGNWSQAIIPNANYNVIIPTGLTNYPSLSKNTGAKNLTLGDGASIDLNGFLFNIEEVINLGNNASIAGSQPGSVLHFSGENPQILPDNLLQNGELANLHLENLAGLTINQDLRLLQTLKVISGSLTTNDKLTLACEFTSPGVSTGMAQVAAIGTNGSINGNLIAEQCFPGRRAFRLISAPLSTNVLPSNNSIHYFWQENASAYNNNPNPGHGTHITGTTTDQTNGFDYTPSGNPSMFEFNNTSQTWSPIANTNNTSLNAGDAYRILIRGSRGLDVTKNTAIPNDTKLRTRGELFTGETTLTGFNSTAGSFNFFGNPYPAAVDMRKVLNSPKTKNAGRFIYIYDPNLGGNADANPDSSTLGGRGGFVTLDADDFSASVDPNVQGIQNTDANLFLQPMQAAFFVTANQGTAPELNFQESFKAVDEPATAVFRPAASHSSIQINLYRQQAFLNGETPLDGLKIKFGTNFNNPIDAYDAPKLFNLDESISRFEQGQYIAIESRALPTAQENLSLALTNYRAKHYVLQIHVGELNQSVYLEDSYLGTQQILQKGENTIAFQVDDQVAASTDPLRFALVTDKRLGTNLIEKQTPSVYPNPLNGNILQIDFDQPSTTPVNIAIYNLLGQRIYQQQLNQHSGKVSLSNLKLTSGLYLIEILDIEKQSKQQIKLLKN